MYCRDCEKEIHVGRANYILLHEGSSDRARLFLRESFQPGFQLGYSPQLISDIFFEEIDNEVVVYFKYMCGVEGCGYRVLESELPGKKKIEFIKIHDREMSLDDFLLIFYNKDQEKYINIIK